MSLTPGTKLGPYEVLAPLGVGGMGEVYRARDTELGREAPIKLPPDELTKDLRATLALNARPECSRRRGTKLAKSCELLEGDQEYA